MGRLAPQKGFDLLIDAFSRVAGRHPQWSLQILGEGPDRPALERLIDVKGLAGRVVLAGWEPDPSAVLQQGDLFVLSSRFEGFPNALLEAMACGLPSVSFNCQSGPAEIIRDQIDGILVPPEDVPGLADAIDRALTDEALRRRLAARRCELSNASASSVTSPGGTPFCAATLPRAQSTCDQMSGEGRGARGQGSGGQRIPRDQALLGHAFSGSSASRDESRSGASRKCVPKQSLGTRWKLGTTGLRTVSAEFCATQTVRPDVSSVITHFQVSP